MRIRLGHSITFPFDRGWQVFCEFYCLSNRWSSLILFYRLILHKNLNDVDMFFSKQITGLFPCYWATIILYWATLVSPILYVILCPVCFWIKKILKYVSLYILFIVSHWKNKHFHRMIFWMDRNFSLSFGFHLSNHKR